MKTIILMLTMAFTGCATTPCSVDAKPCPAPAATCATACANGAKHECGWANPTPAGHTCLEVCTNAAQTVPWNVAGLTSAATCTP